MDYMTGSKLSKISINAWGIGGDTFYKISQTSCFLTLLHATFKKASGKFNIFSDVIKGNMNMCSYYHHVNVFCLKIVFLKVAFKKDFNIDNSLLL